MSFTVQAFREKGLTLYDCWQTVDRREFDKQLGPCSCSQDWVSLIFVSLVEMRWVKGKCCCAVS